MNADSVTGDADANQPPYRAAVAAHLWEAGG
jgi:hypothetical protein